MKVFQRTLLCLCAFGATPLVAQESTSPTEAEVVVGQAQEKDLSGKKARGGVKPTRQERELREINLKLRELIDALVKSGALDEAVVKEFLRSTNEAIVEQYGPVQEDETSADLERQPAEDVIRVPYIPEFIKDEIRNQVSDELSEEVTKDVVAKAKQERWGVPAALPEWMGRISFNGDIRVRGQFNRFDDANSTQIPDTMAINSGLNTNDLQDQDEFFLDFTNNEELARLRMRLGMDMSLGDHVRLHARMATGNRDNPVSANWTFDGDSSSDIYLDMAYFEWFTRYEGLKFQGGKMANPHFTNTQLVWDSDFTFPGFSLEYWPLRLTGNRGRPQIFDPYIRAGYFMLDELDRGQDDKLFYSAQIGTRIHFSDAMTWEVAAAYYDFKNVTGVRNPSLDLGLTDDTAPDFVQKGNTLFQIQNSSDPGELLLALASEFSVLDIASTLTYSFSERYQMQLLLNYVENVGFDEDEFYTNVGADENGFADNFGVPVKYSEETDGYYIGMSFGDKDRWVANHWLASVGYRYLEKDAVLDAYTNSDFHLGGTDAEGYIGKFSYAFADRSALTIKYMSSNEVQGLTPAGLRIDVLQADLEFKF